LRAFLEQIIEQHREQKALIYEENSVIVHLAKQLIPPEDLTDYNRHVSMFKRRDNLREFSEYIDHRRRTMKLTEQCTNARIPLSRKAQTGYTGSTEQEEENRRDETTYASNDRFQSTRESLGNRFRKPEQAPDVPKGKYGCKFCEKDDHAIWKCEAFKMKNTGARYLFVKNNRLCYRCLGEGHIAKKCTRFPGQTCKIDGCKSEHHRLLHNRKEEGLVTVETYLCQEDDRDEENEEEKQIEKPPAITCKQCTPRVENTSQ
jgi:hypothetical protein